MKTKRLFSLLFVISFAVCGCRNNTSSSSDNNIEKVVGTCIFDKYADQEGYAAIKNSDEPIVIESVPNILIERNNYNEPGFLWPRLGQEHTYYPDSLYIADVNFDGHDDVCISESMGSGMINLKITIFDFYNKGILYILDGRSEYRDYSFKILDEELVVVDTQMFSYTETPSISRIGHFINKKDKKVNIEWENMPFKVIDVGISLIHDDQDNYKIADKSKDYEDKIERYVIDSSLSWKLSFVLYYEGEITTNTKYVDDCATFATSNNYEISFIDYNPRGLINYNLKVLNTGLIDIKTKVVDIDLTIHLDAR